MRIRPVGGSESFRASVQPLVRDAAQRVVRVVRRREPVRAMLGSLGRAVAQPVPLARAGVAVFAMALLVPTVMPAMRAERSVLVAAMSETRGATGMDTRLPDQNAGRPPQVRWERSGASCFARGDSSSGSTSVGAPVAGSTRQVMRSLPKMR